MITFTCAICKTQTKQPDEIIETINPFTNEECSIPLHYCSDGGTGILMDQSC
jgi:hypothetical protein